MKLSSVALLAFLLLSCSSGQSTESKSDSLAVDTTSAKAKPAPNEQATEQSATGSSFVFKLDEFNYVTYQFPAGEVDKFQDDSTANYTYYPNDGTNLGSVGREIKIFKGACESGDGYDEVLTKTIGGVNFTILRTSDSGMSQYHDIYIYQFPFGDYCGQVTVSYNSTAPGVVEGVTKTYDAGAWVTKFEQGLAKELKVVVNQ